MWEPEAWDSFRRHFCRENSAFLATIWRNAHQNHIVALLSLFSCDGGVDVKGAGMGLSPENSSELCRGLAAVFEDNPCLAPETPYFRLDGIGKEESIFSILRFLFDCVNYLLYLCFNIDGNQRWETLRASIHYIDARSFSSKLILTEGRYWYKGHSSLTYLNVIPLMKRRTEYQVVYISIRVEIRSFVKVKAYTRIRFGKKEKVKSYYRSK